MTDTMEKAKALFTYLRELSALRIKTIKHVADYEETIALRELSALGSFAEVSFRDRENEEESGGETVLFRFRKPEFEACPKPSEALLPCLKEGWNDYRRELKRKKEATEAEGSPEQQRREQEFDAFSNKRSAWQNRQKEIEKARQKFGDYYRMYLDLERNGERMELVVANGFFLAKDDPGMYHPILTRRVGMAFDAYQNELIISDLDVDTGLYTAVFQGLKGIDSDAVRKLQELLRENDYHPLDRVELPKFLRMFAHRISPEGTYAEEGVPEGWEEHNRFLLFWNPVFLYRKRIDGTPRFLQSVLDDLTETGTVPGPIGDIVAGGRKNRPKWEEHRSVEEKLAAVGGEDMDILLSKEANREQLEIAERIEHYDAVLVQGPPGTGKTHTIANLMGHFLAYGRSVLVTSQSPKALSVLKNQVSRELRSLCVSVLDDTREDMERSIDEITEFLSLHTSAELLRQAELLKEERMELMEALSRIRKEIYEIIYTECNQIVVQGEGISPTAAAKFVAEREEAFGYIPGRILSRASLPLAIEELEALYRTNEALTPQEERELACDLPEAGSLISPESFEELLSAKEDLTRQMKAQAAKAGWEVTVKESHFSVDFGEGFLPLHYPKKELIDRLERLCRNLGFSEEWMKYAAVDGKRGGGHLKRWEMLITSIEETCEFADALVEEAFGYEIEVLVPSEAEAFLPALHKLRSIFARRGKVSRLDLFANRNLGPALDGIRLNGEEIASKKECDLAIHMIELLKRRRQCAVYWDALIAKHGGIPFQQLDLQEPERVAENWVDVIVHNLHFYDTTTRDMNRALGELGIGIAVFSGVERSDSSIEEMDKVLTAVQELLPKLLEIARFAGKLDQIREGFGYLISVLRQNRRKGSEVCGILSRAVEEEDPRLYREGYAALSDLKEQTEILEKREELLNRLEQAAPDWADAIRNRVGRHGAGTAPANLAEAWKWKQLSAILADLSTHPYDTLQKESVELSREYRMVTAQYAEKLAWFHLLERTEADLDMRQALNGWKLTVKKIGKGTGKNAPKLKAEARKLMAKCQMAVPAWIMPAGRVIESLDPARNHFDVVIIDEASQSDVTALGITYLADKVIIVGDDKQVSPLAVGTAQSRMDDLEKMYLKDVIPNSHLYGTSTSLYDIAATTYQPLLLREHFRCVPDIIEFCNGLSYDYKIKPLRDGGSSSLHPAVILHRADGGKRIDRQNPKEARTVVSLIRACLSYPEYQDKTIGVISLLGSEQARAVSDLIYREIGPQQIEKHRILCGDPSNFQGDERDVIFLTMVDSPDEAGPLKKREFGVGDADRKRYNVAVSRARDQLWVITSLDATRDLKPGDLRKRLIDYAEDPQSFRQVKERIEAASDSPFETEVATRLTELGYQLVQQWPVGAYRIDMVAVGAHGKIAIECDGERYHSGEEKVREDMERQTILERSGWRFIRIRGSEFYRNREQTLERVVNELTAYGIEPMSDRGNGTLLAASEYTAGENGQELLGRIRVRADILLQEMEATLPKETDRDSIRFALGQ